MWDFSTYSLDDLKIIREHIWALEGLGLTQDKDMKLELQREIEKKNEIRRKRLGLI